MRVQGSSEHDAWSIRLSEGGIGTSITSDHTFPQVVINTVSCIVTFRSLKIAARLACDIHLQRQRGDPHRALAPFAMLRHLVALTSLTSQT
jgi:hypothetical protein